MQRIGLIVDAFDPSGCEGILVDIRTMQVYRVFGVAVVSAVIAQNTQTIEGIYHVPIEHVGAQLEALRQDFDLTSVKIGIVPDLSTARLIADTVRDLRIPIVLDPVYRTTRGYPVFPDVSVYREWVAVFRDAANIITPNVEEAAILAEMDEVASLADMRSAAERIHEQYGFPTVIVTGGRLRALIRASDVIFDGRRHRVAEHPWVPRPNRLGVGTVFATLIAILSAQGISIEQAVETAKRFIGRAMQHAFEIGRGEYHPLNLYIPRV